MNGWRSRAAATLAFILAWPAPFYLAGTASAQTTLFPSAQEPDAAGPPVVLTPPPGDGTAVETAPAVERAPEGIEVDPLAAVASDYGGTLDPGAGGLPIDMWRGTDRGFVERLLPELPFAPQSPALRDLARRLLLSSAEAPAGPAHRNLQAVRAERLAALGDRGAAAALLAQIPESQRDATTERMRLEAAWLAGEDDRACADVAGLIQRYDQDLYLQKALIFCQARAGQTDQATLGLDLMREQGHAEDAAFFDMVSVLTGLRKQAKVETLGEPRGLNTALMRATGTSLPDDAMASDPDKLDALLASDDPAVRLAAMEQAAGLGRVEPSTLAQAYAAEAATPDEVAGAIDAAPDTPHARAVLYQAALKAVAPTARAALIQKALAAARGAADGHAGYLTAARVYLPLIVDLAPAPAIAAAAGEFGRALYLGSQYELAAAWLDTARAEADRNPDAAAAVPVLWLLARIAGGAEPLVWDARSVAAWQQAQAGDAGAGLRAARLFAVLDGLDEPADAAWQVLADPQASAGDAGAQPGLNAPLWFALGDAAAAGRVGETVMLALFALGPDGPGATHPIALSRALASLRAVGLDQDARRIAFEAAIANGV